MERVRFGGHGPALLIGASVLLAFIVELDGYSDEFPNADIAGIAYQADLIRAGGLPYIDTLEVKGMGTFWLWAAIIAVFGRSLFAIQAAYVGWHGLGMLGVFVGARTLYGHRHPYAAALATAFYGAHALMFSYNYSGWMTPLLAWTFALVVLSLQRPSWVRSIMAGAVGVTAYLFKHQAIGFVAAFPALAFWAHRTRAPGMRAATIVGWALGVTAVLAVPLAVYGRLGRWDALAAGLFPLERVSGYRAAAAEIGTLELAARATLQFVVAFPVGAVLLTVLAIGLAIARTSEDRDVIPVAGFFVASCITIAIGGARFFPHYLIQYLPATALLVGHPAGLLRHATRRRWPYVLVGLSVLFQLLQIAAGRAIRNDIVVPRLSDGRSAAQAAGAYIRERTTPLDRIQVWGWTAWPVYFWAERRAPGRIYKPMGTVTSTHGSTAFRRSPPIRFQPGPAADEFLETLERDPPAYFVYSSAFVTSFGSPNDPIEAFVGLRRLLAERYVPVADFGDLRLFERR